MLTSGARRRTGLLCVMLGVLAVTACSSHTSSAPSPAPSTPTAPSSEQSSTAATSTASDTPAPTVTPTTSAPRSSPGKSTAAHGEANCTRAHLKVTVLRGSGAAGKQYAKLSFTNASTSRCALVGYPGVSLRAGGNELGAPATHSGLAYREIDLNPGAVASTTVTDFSSCNAPLADTVRIYPPNETAYVDLPLRLRGCQLMVDPVTLDG